MRRTLAVAVGIALCLGGLVSAEHAGPSPSPAASSIHLPLAFEANAGQASQEVRAVVEQLKELFLCPWRAALRAEVIQNE